MDAAGAERVAVVGTGNVALDVARVLTADPARLADSAIAPAALERLRSSRVREVVLLGRRGPEHAAYTRGELLALRHRDDLEVVVDDHDPRVGEAIDAAAPGDHAALLQGLRRVRSEDVPPTGGRRRIVLRFHAPTQALLGDDHVSRRPGRRAGRADRAARGARRARGRPPGSPARRACRSTRRPAPSRTTRGAWTAARAPTWWAGSSADPAAASA